PGATEPEEPSAIDAAAAAAAEEARAIYSEVLVRNPEHDFQPTIVRVVALMELLGEPQHAFRPIHTTRAAGKPSPARIIDSRRREVGLRPGRFTSPHLHRGRERIAIDGDPIRATRFVEVWRDIEPYVNMVDAELQDRGESRLSFFEVLTGLAYAAFADTPADVAVIEVGTGGEWESDNGVDGDDAAFAPTAPAPDKGAGATATRT